MQPIQQPPFYAVEIVAGLLASTGGGKRNERGQVIGHDGKPIPRLYEAGELGSTAANLPQRGHLLGECMVFGRIAGANAVRKSAWVDADGAGTSMTSVVAARPRKRNLR
jgi:succinate dehydrogenase/fumarate reductase flavoprotein subunit